MANQLNISHEFASVVKQLHKTPDDRTLKQSLIKMLPAMMALAKENPVALFRLAQIHAPTSSQYKQMMRQSAARGCTNAMLAISEVLLNSNSVSAADLKTAAHYLSMIERSKDSYMIKQSRALLTSHPEVAALMKTEFKSDTYNSNIRFFTTQPERGIQREPQVENSFTM